MKVRRIARKAAAEIETSHNHVQLHFRFMVFITVHSGNDYAPPELVHPIIMSYTLCQSDNARRDKVLNLFEQNVCAI
jgi:hypothetical protein